MYQPSHFVENRPEVLHALMQRYPLATLVTVGPEGPVANHIPLVLRTDAAGGVCLAGHVARANPIWQAEHLKAPALAIFQGPQHYISPNWYPSKQAHGKAVPTWNYAVVHASGPLIAHDDAAWVGAQLRELTDAHEQSLPQPWRVDDAPADFTERLTGMLVGIELKVARLEGKWKVSQNQPDDNRRGVVQGLQALSNGLSGGQAQAMADLVLRYPDIG
jgi:transcriptional regulator